MNPEYRFFQPKRAALNRVQVAGGNDWHYSPRREDSNLIVIRLYEAAPLKIIRWHLASG